jgi:hypothetical protein
MAVMQAKINTECLQFTAFGKNSGHGREDIGGWGVVVCMAWRMVFG